jgi:SAM-dependent methyltransferase
MGDDGPAFYDNGDVFATYRDARQRSQNANDTLELPVIRELIGGVDALRVLNLGCGDAAIGHELLAGGAASYVGIDGSRRMVAAAEQVLAGTTGRVVLQRMEDWHYPHGAFDLVLSRLAVHYVADFAALCGHVYRTLDTHGRFVFSVEHPVVTSCDRAKAPGSERQDWVVDDYFVTGPRVRGWLGGTVRKYHRTVEDYFGGLRDAGFAVEDLRESRRVGRSSRTKQSTGGGIASRSCCSWSDAKVCAETTLEGGRSGRGGPTSWAT